MTTLNAISALHTMNNAPPQVPSPNNNTNNANDICSQARNDAKAAHFLRHEVKNGVLAAMGILGNLQGIVDSLQQQDDDSPLVSHLAELNSTLGQLLQRVVDSAMTLEVVHGAYVATEETVDLPTLLTNRGDVQDRARFPVSSPKNFPSVLIDPNLVRTIHDKAVSNACKFGKPNGQVQTSLSYDYTRQTVRMEVENAPGPGHEQLLQLTSQEQETIFQENSQLKAHAVNTSNGSREVELISEGNGAWMMQHCATTMGGTCSVVFEPHRTVLVLECPAKVSPEWKQQQQQLLRTTASVTPTNTTTTTISSDSSFKLPEDTQCIIMEDSPVQRKMLQRYLSRAGIPNERCTVWGQTNEDIYEFVARATQLIQDKPSNFLILMDEHLDIVEGGVVTKTVSGSNLVQQLRQSLPATEEGRILALIRSANDSAEERQRYQERAHGFITKGPLKQGNLLQAIQPWWEKRFNTPSPIPTPPPRTSFSPPPRKRSRACLVLPTTLGGSRRPTDLKVSKETLLLARQSLSRQRASSFNCNWDHKALSTRLLSSDQLTQIRTNAAAAAAGNSSGVNNIRSYKSTPALAHGQSLSSLRNFFFARA